MYKSEQQKRIFSIMSNFILWFFETFTFAVVWFKWYHIPYNSHFFKYGHIAVIGLYSIFMYLLTKSFNGYNVSYMRVMDLALSHILAVICSSGAGYVFICMVFTDYMPAIPVCVGALVQIFFACVWVKLTRVIYGKVFPPRKVIIIYGNYPLENFLSKLNTRTDKYEVREIVNYKKGIEKICSDVLDFEGVFLYDLPSGERNNIIKYCYEHDIRTYVVPKITDIIMRGSENLHLVDTPLFLSRNNGLGIDRMIVKRLMDIIISLLAIIITSPLMLIICIAIKLYDGGTVFYKQERLTLGKKSFMMYKFRSMRIDAEKKGAQLARKEDNRITPVGKVLRRLHLDELPQLFNVLAGQMSVVGPRPERPEIFEKYSKTIPDFDFRLKVKAGITGYAQVYGKYNTAPIDKLKLDLTYIQEYSYWLDIKLMILTFRVIFRKENSEGVDTTI